MWLKDGGGGGERQYAGECPVSVSVSVSVPLCLRLWATGVRMAVPWRESPVRVSVSVPLLFQTVGNRCENGSTMETESC